MTNFLSGAMNMLLGAAIAFFLFAILTYADEATAHSSTVPGTCPQSEQANICIFPIN